MKAKPKDTPPFVYHVKDPQLDIIYFVFSYEPLKMSETLIYQRYVSRFLRRRKRQMQENWLNLPHEVKLLVTLDGKVKEFDLPTQRQLDDEQKVQNRKNRRIEQIRKNLKKKK